MKQILYKIYNSGATIPFAVVIGDNIIESEDKLIIKYEGTTTIIEEWDYYSWEELNNQHVDHIKNLNLI